MRFAIFSDIHANLEALEAVLEDMKSERVSKIVCLGDVVGYNADPAACLELVRSLGCPVVQGNHDFYCSNDSDLSAMNEVAREALEWTREQLSAEQKTWLAELPMTHDMEDFMVVHASLDKPSQWSYVLNNSTAEASMANQEHHVCFCGHTHVPLVFEKSAAGLRMGRYEKFNVQFGKSYLVNCGSVGQPRDEVQDAAYAIYDVRQGQIILKRVKYNIGLATKKIREAGLPERLARRLVLGK